MIVKKALYVLLTLVFFFSSCRGQDKAVFKYKEVPLKLNKSKRVLIDLKGFIEVSNYLPKGYSKRGNIDYTIYIQKALDENPNLVFPDFPILVNQLGLELQSNSKIFFREKSKITIEPNSLTNYSIFNLKNISNVAIYNPRLVGDKYAHLSSKGEWGMGINIVGSQNIKIFNPIISKCWGDGIYINDFDGIKSKNILIEGGIVDDNRRNGISVISGENISINDIVLSNTSGTLPMAGIDLEPNHNHEELKNIVLKNIVSYNNGDAGFLIFLGSFLGENQKTVDIRFLNCTDYYSAKAISIPGLLNNYDKTIKKIKGQISFEGFTTVNSGVFFSKSSGSYTYTPPIFVKKFQIQQENKKDLDSELKFRKWFKERSIQVE
ncbi:right-handed parallel beta-helix repeat-containing protein [Flavobacterium sp. HSC-61S13]|uniref:right-handed parallel beta-helix repeat-containing protein n=1 Tax=Flavobacterium sp. HSC-61S13 TaxID=2910963 RepID=UPI0020A143D1|nr:right-handed parallel beta-helix repeat-containing protein [Flavobacterium sp. HSC-61S13]MCP1997431.1 hypothetical protein [Flavobacterium sp. HSC-61S13]